MTTSASASPIEPEILGPEEEEKTARTVRRGIWQSVRKGAAQIPFMEEVVASYYCAMDPATPARVRLTLLGALAYFVMPIDAIPDILAGIGFTDDAGVLMGAIAMVGAHIRDVHRNAARKALTSDNKPADGAPRSGA